MRHLFFQYRGKIKIKAITNDIDKKIARLRFGQAFSNEEQDKKMYGFFKTLIQLIGGYIDTTALFAVGRISNKTVVKYQFKPDEQESEAWPNSPVPENKT